MTFPEAPKANPFEAVTRLPRRSIIGSLSLAGLGLLAASPSARAFTSQKGVTTPKVTVQTQRRGTISATERTDLSGLPPEWAQQQGRVLRDYTLYLAGLKLKTISPGQVIEAHAKCKGSIWNSLPPKAWWTRMGYTLRVADRIALEMNVKDVEIVSAYRSPAYNACCAGAKRGSWHQANVAVDIKFPMRAANVASAARNLRDRGLFKGGVGSYWNFTHIDTRGENVNW